MTVAIVKIYGASDDLIELDGDIYEEFEASEGGDLLAFSEGTVLRIRYDGDGIWRITPVTKGSAALVVEQCPATDDSGTDTATLTGDVAWVVLGSKFEPARSTCHAVRPPVDFRALVAARRAERVDGEGGD